MAHPTESVNLVPIYVRSSARTTTPKAISRRGVLSLPKQPPRIGVEAENHVLILVPSGNDNFAILNGHS